MERWKLRMMKRPTDKVDRKFCSGCKHAKKESDFIKGKKDNPNSAVRICAGKETGPEVCYLGQGACENYQEE